MLNDNAMKEDGKSEVSFQGQTLVGCWKDAHFKLEDGGRLMIWVAGETGSV